MDFLDKIERVIKTIETSKTPFVYFICTFFSAIILRNFLEIFSTGQKLSFAFFSHFDVSYVFLAMALIILFHFATKEKVQKISRVVLPSFLILNIVPIVDMISSFGKGYQITYISPSLLNFFTFFGPFNGNGMSLGIRIEVALVILGSFTYFFIKNRNIKKSLLFLFLTYCLIFIYCSFAFLVPLSLTVLGIDFELSEILVGNFYLFFIFFLGVWLFYLYNKRYFVEIVKDIRILRLIHFELMFVFGAVLATILSPMSFQLTGDTLFYWIFLIVAIASAWLFAIITNNLADYQIDKITNKTRPTVTGKIPMKHYKKLPWAFFLIAALYSSTVNFTSLFLILLFMGNGFLYSMPPLRFKRITFFSKLFISLNSLILFMLGYNFISGNMDIPAVVAVFFLVFFTAAVNFIDIKDYRGDKKAGIKTLPVIFGLRKSKIIIGLFFLIVYSAVYIIFRDIYLIPSLIILGLTQFFLINRKKYNEKPVLVVYLFSVILLIFYLILRFYMFS